jgi:hypothetical protein
MLCKYCHLKTHLIDKCPTIICKICKDIGHPQWLCKEKKKMKKDHKKDNTKYETKYESKYESKKDNNYAKIIDNKYSFSDEIKKKEHEVIEKNINYYLKFKDELWSNLA